MAEDWVVGDLVLPGTFIRVRAEGLIGLAGISSGNIGIVGVGAVQPPFDQAETQLLSTAAEAQAVFGPAVVDSAAKALNFTAMINELFRGGARTVYARGLGASPADKDYDAAFAEIVKEDVQILVAPGLATAKALTLFQGILNIADAAQQDLMAVVGMDGKIDDIVKAGPANGRVVLVTPGYSVIDPTPPAAGESAPAGPGWVDLPGSYSAGPVAALIASLPPQVSPTNKALPIGRLARRYSYAERTTLVKGRVLALEERNGVRVVRGITTDPGPFAQITTRRIVDYAKSGIRQVSNPFIGRLNNARVRAALQSAIDGLLTSMLVDEQLTAYKLEVTATRRDEIEGRAIVNALLQPTFSIDYVAVTIVLQ